MENSLKPPTVFVDIDGTLTFFELEISKLIKNYTPSAIPGCAEKLAEWHQKGIRIILTTGRTEPMREDTERQLKACGFIYDQLIMGCGSGKRFIINDTPNNDTTVVAICLERNLGIKDLNLENL